MKATSDFPASESVTARVLKRPADSRGTTQFDWLQSWHSFSFGEYFDPDAMGYRSLRVINEDIIAPGGGFGLHPHRDAEIFTYVISGAVEHRDSLGSHGIIQSGDLQYMSAGDGVLHSEFNPSRRHETHLLQIWLRPNELGGSPRYSEKKLGASARSHSLTLLFAPEDRDDATAIRQDAEIYYGRLENGHELELPLQADRGIWIQMIKGQLDILEQSFQPGDGAIVEGEGPVSASSAGQTEFLLFSLR